MTAPKTTKNNALLFTPSGKLTRLQKGDQLIFNLATSTLAIFRPKERTEACDGLLCWGKEGPKQIDLPMPLSAYSDWDAVKDALFFVDIVASVVCLAWRRIETHGSDDPKSLRVQMIGQNDHRRQTVADFQLSDGAKRDTLRSSSEHSLSN